MQNNISEPSRGISYKFLKTDRFKTTVISMGFYLPIDGGAAANSLALSLMRSGTAALPEKAGVALRSNRLVMDGKAGRRGGIQDKYKRQCRQVFA